jgi:hypothetical protein
MRYIFTDDSGMHDTPEALPLTYSGLLSKDHNTGRKSTRCVMIDTSASTFGT